MSRKIIISVDFGTTYSGVAYSDPGNPHADPVLLTEWGRTSSDKVPTVLRYNVSEMIRGLAGYKWGQEVKSIERRHEWFKLELDDMQYKATTSVDLSRKYPSKVDEAPHYDKKAKDFAIDFLTSLRKHVVSTLSDKFGSQAFKALRQEWIITVPAVWSLQAKETTRECAEAAGMGKGSTLQMISEPEAAAAYTLHKLEPHNLRVNDNIVICDAGGGTVDLITYRIKRLPPTLQVEESGIPSGGKCGSVFLNRVFEDWVEKKLGHKVTSLSTESREEMIRQFELYSKREFSDEDEDAIFVPVNGVPNNAAAGVIGGRLRITPAEMKSIFDIVVEEVITLVKGQIRDVTGGETERSIAAVLLVGGFGESYYLMKRLKAAVGTNTLQVLRPPNSWTAVARGAAMKALAASDVSSAWKVESRKSQAFFGTVVARPFQRGVHRESYKYWDAFYGEFRCSNCVDWMIKRGDALQEAVSIKHHFFRYIPVTAGHTSFIFEDGVYQSFANKAPTYCTENGQMLGALKTDLNVVPKFKLDKRTGKDYQEYYVVDYALHMTFYSASVKVEFEYKDVTYSSVWLEFAKKSPPSAVDKKHLS